MKDIIKELKNFMPAIIVIAIVSSAVTTTANAVDIGTLNTVKAADKTEKEEDTAPVPEVDIKKDALDSDAASAENISAAKDTSLDGQKFKDGVYTGVGKGFNGNIHVEVTIKDGKISEIKITQHSDDQPYINNAMALINNIIQTQSVAVDTVSGATYSSKGIIDAVKDALNKAIDSANSNRDASDDTDAAEDSSQNNSDDADTSETSKDTSLDGQKFKDGTYTGVGKGFNGNIYVEVTIKDGKISNIKVTQHSDDQPYMNNAAALIDNIVKTQSIAVDTVSGATYSSKGIISAVKNALNKALLTSDPNLDETEDPADTSTESETDTDQNDEEDNNYEIEYGNYADGIYIGKARGYKSIFTATVVITNGSIASIDIEQADDEAYYLKCVGLIQRIITHQTTAGIDTVSGCTSSSNGILNSVKAALAKAALPEETEGTEE